MAGVWVDGTQVFIVHDKGYCATCGEPYVRGWESSHPRCRWQWAAGGVEHDVRSGACECGAWHGKSEQAPNIQKVCGRPVRVAYVPDSPEIPCSLPAPCAIHAWAQGSCTCRWNRRVHGDACPEHGTRNAALPVVLPVAPAPDPVSGGNAVSAALAYLAEEDDGCPPSRKKREALSVISQRLAILEGLAATECDRDHAD